MMAQALKSPPFAKGGVEGFSLAPHHATPHSAGKLVEGDKPPTRASARIRPFVGIRRGGNPPNPPFAKGGLALRPAEDSVRPPPSFRRRPESRTPVYPGISRGRVWIPAFAGMTVGGGNDDKVVLRYMALVEQGCPALYGVGGTRAFLPHPNPLPLGEGFFARRRNGGGNFHSPILNS